MYLVAVAEVKEGMIIGDNIVVGGKTVIKKGTKVDNIILKQLKAFKLIAVNIMEEEDFAETYYGKVRVSRAFKKFELDYTANLVAYKVAADSFMYKKVPFRIDDLMQIVNNLVPDTMIAKTLFTYLYLHVPEEENLTYAHGLNVALICKIFAKWLGFNEMDTRQLCTCGFLYDIGKLTIPSDILWKRAKLAKMEYDLIKTHAFHGYYLLSHYSPNVTEHVLRATLEHHEHIDGTGYPQGLTGKDMDPFSKIMSILDIYEAMTSARPYRDPKCPYQVMQIFEEKGFQHYDIPFLQLFMKHIADELIGNRVILNDGSTWDVMMNNANDYSRPVLSRDSEILDLSKNRELCITGII